MAANLQKFLDQARYWAVTHKAVKGNSYHKEICSIAGIGTSTAWCAAFVSACAKKSGNNSVVGMNNGAGGVCNTVIKKGGTWIKGPAVGCNVKPKPGDLLLKVSSKYPIKYDSNGKRTSALHGKHVAVVYKATSTYVYTYEGNYGGKAADVRRKISDKTIAGYARPKWATYGGPLYTEENDRHDMTMREIGYMNSKGKLTKSATDYQISLINYTTLLGDLYDVFARNTYGSNIINTSNLKGNEKIVIEYLLSQGFNAAAACGIAANIKTDSNYEPSTLVSLIYYGICKWSGAKALLLLDSLGLTGWTSDLSGQLDFLMADLQDNYSSLITSLQKVAISAKGAKSAASQFAKTYKKISSTSTREAVAQSIYNNLIVTPPKQAGTIPNTQTTNKTCTVIDVSKKAQKVLNACYKNFDIGECDTDMRKEWESKGKSTSKGLSYMDSCYLVAYNTKYSIKVEDYLELETDAGTIKCIVAGAFNNVDTPILFYRDRNDNILLKDWANCKIQKIKDYGKRTK